MVRHHLDPALQADQGQAVTDEVDLERPVEERLDRGDGDRRVVGLHGPVQRQEDLVVAIVHPGDVDQATTHGRPTGEHLEVDVLGHQRRGPLGAEHLAQLRRHPTQHRGGVGLDDPGLLARDGQLPAGGEVRVVAADAGHDRHLGTDHVGRVVAAQQTDLDHSDVDRRLGEPAQRRGGHQLEPGGPHRQERLDRADPVEHLRQRLVVDRLTVTTEAFVDPLQMGAGGAADAEAVSLEQPHDHRRHRPLAVGAGDVDGRHVELRVAEQRHQLAHGGQVEAVDLTGGDARRAGLVVQVGVEPRQRFDDAHGSGRSGNG